MAEVGDPDDLDQPYAVGSALHKSLALWITLDSVQQRIDDCFTKFCLIELIIGATKLFNDFVDGQETPHQDDQETATTAPDWYAERLALRSVLGKLAVPRLRKEALKAGVATEVVNRAHVAKGSTLERGQVHDL
eukprot:COSAG01_NODE_19038_length_1035_cov_0.892094_2_plen_133_part_01